MPKIIPPIVFLFSLLALLALEYFHPSGWGEIRSSSALPWDIALFVGAILLIGARLQFQKTDSEIHTFKEPRTLLMNGLFKFSRNPMYLGFSVLLFAAAYMLTRFVL